MSMTTSQQRVVSVTPKIPTYESSVLDALAVAGTKGITAKEMETQTYVPMPPKMSMHENASMAFSTLKKKKKIFELNENEKGSQRGGHAVYVLSQFLDGRSFNPYKAQCETHTEKIEDLEDTVRKLRAQQREIRALIKGNKTVAVADIRKALRRKW